VTSSTATSIKCQEKMSTLLESLLQFSNSEDGLEWIISFYSIFIGLVDRYVSKGIYEFSPPLVVFLLTFFSILHCRCEGDNLTLLLCNPHSVIHIPLLYIICSVNVYTSQHLTSHFTQ
jgi:hypothetical protein